MSSAFQLCTLLLGTVASAAASRYIAPGPDGKYTLSAPGITAKVICSLQAIARSVHIVLLGEES